uniref:AIP/AIPL N-terminal FKBP-type PPIase domain-containing protein n=1 Tax=Timema tahoe TaxID=61484 RepID=A0A7R9FIH3_9NEOP|nr:unnamed protein product [Timema tahoe]
MVFFHFETRKCDDDRTLVDSSRELGKPMELVLGKKFKFEVWENVVQMMALNEVARFTVNKSLVSGYPFVSKTLREAGKPQDQRRHHCCGVTLQNEGIGYQDLNQLIKDPCDLEFTIELVKVEAPEDYEKESWQMNEEEKLGAVPALREEGNRLYRGKDYVAAASKYTQAIGLLEQLMLSEKPGDEEFLKLEKEKRPLLLNFSQCKLQERDFYAENNGGHLVADNVKALFRRGKAHVGAWNPAEARADLRKVTDLDPSLAATVFKELKVLDEMERKKDLEDKEKFQGKMF